MSRITVWSIPVDEAAAPAQGDLALLDADERARADRFLFPRDRALHVAAHAALRRILGAATGIAPEQLVFAREGGGKPYLAGSAPAFNLSHTRGHALIAVAPRGRIGVDVERVRPLEDPKLARRVMTRAEYAAWLALPPDRRSDAMLRLWCAKEAWLKARGLGLGFDPGKVESRLGQADSISDEGGRPWTIHRLALGPGLVGAVAAEGTTLAVELIAGDRMPP